MTTSDNQCVRRIQTESEGDRRKCDLTRGSSEEDWLLSVRRHGRWWCPLQGRRGRAPSKQAHRRQPPPSLDWQRLVGPPTSPPPPLCRLVAFPSHQCSLIKDMSDQEVEGKLAVFSPGGGGRGEGILTYLPPWRARWVSPSRESQLCRDNTDAVRDGNAIEIQMTAEQKNCSVAKHRKVLCSRVAGS